MDMGEMCADKLSHRRAVACLRLPDQFQFRHSPIPALR